MRHLSVLSLALLFQLAAHSASAQGNAQQQAQEYAQEHGFQVKQVTAGTPQRPISRTFVPITPQSYPAFLRRFNSTRGFVQLVFNNGNNHMVMGLKPPTAEGKPADCYLWARNYNGTVQGIGDYRNMYMSHNNNGYCMSLALPNNKLSHLTNWLNARANPQDNLYRRGNCMEWLPNAEVSPNRPLFHDLGIRRSKDGRNMKAKLLHGANNQIGVVGMFVPDANTFNTMTNEQLMGPPPAGGIADAMR
jgi:hypothetical protein